MSTIELRACRFSYIVFGVICGLPMALSLIVSWRSESIFPGFLIALFALIAFYSWLGFFKLGLHDNIVTYRTLLNGTHSIPINNIAKITIESGYKTYLERSKPFVRLVVHPKDLAISAPIYVNMKIFDRNELVIFLRMLEKFGVSILRK